MRPDLLERVLEGPVLPSAPKLVQRAIEVVRGGGTDGGQLRELIELDPATTLRVLREANASDVASDRPASTVPQALRFLRPRALESVLLGCDLPRPGERGQFDHARYWRQALTAAFAAQSLAGKEPTLRDEAYAAGLLQDIGVLALQEAVPEAYERVLQERARNGVRVHQAERSVLGVDHVAVGTELLRSWRLPAILWRPVSAHHGSAELVTLDPVEERLASVLCVAARVAEVLCSAQDAGPLLELYDVARERLGVQRRRVDGLLAEIEPRLRQASEWLDVDLGQGTGYGSLLREANALLSRMSIDMGHSLDRAEEHAERTDRQARELRLARHAAEEESAAKSAFLANLSHEIRTPMTAILGFLDLIEADDQSRDELLDRVGVIRRNAEHLLCLLDDVLDVSKLEAGALLIERTRVAVPEIVEDVVALMRERAAEKGLELELRWEGPIPDAIHTDPTRLRQVLFNVVSNAVKFTERGTVRLRVWLLDAWEAPAPRVAVEVRDSGVGIPEAYRARLFEPFTQADASTARRFGGTGLGLAICKRLTRLLGGDIELESTEGEGTTVRFWVATGALAHARRLETSDDPGRLGESTAPVSTPAPPPSRIEGRVLVAEDGADNQRLIRMLLQQAGLDVETADDGRQALEMARRSREHGAPYDLILMDVQMPHVDGLSAAGTLREEGWTGPIVALTANSTREDRRACIAAGCDEHVPKPIDRARLLRTLADYLKPD